MNEVATEAGHAEAVCRKLELDGFQLHRDTVAGIPVTVAQKKQFKMAWMATQMNMFILVGVPPSVTADTINAFSNAAIDYAIRTKTGLPRGFQAGVACFALLVSPAVDEAAKAWAAQKPPKRWAASIMPVVYDATTRTLHYYRKTPLWGAIYYKSFRQMIEKYFA